MWFVFSMLNILKLRLFFDKKKKEKQGQKGTLKQSKDLSVRKSNFLRSLYTERQKVRVWWGDIVVGQIIAIATCHSLQYVVLWYFIYTHTLSINCCQTLIYFVLKVTLLIRDSATLATRCLLMEALNRRVMVRWMVIVCDSKDEKIQAK